MLWNGRLKGKKYSIFWLGLGGRGNKILNLSEILPVYLVDRLYLSVADLRNLPMTNTAYVVGFQGHRKLIAVSGKFAAVSRGIWQTGPWNLEKFAAENCGPYAYPSFVSENLTHHNSG